MSSFSHAIFHCYCIVALLTLSNAQQNSITAEVKLGYELVAENPEVFKTCIKTDVATCESNALCVKGGENSKFCLPKFFSSDFQDILDLKDPATSKLTVCGKNEATTPETCKTTDGCALCGTACFPSETSDGKDFKLNEVCKARDVYKLISGNILAADAETLYQKCSELIKTCSSNDKCYEAVKEKICLPKSLETESLTTGFITMLQPVDAQKVGGLELYTGCTANKTASANCVDCEGVFLPSSAESVLPVCEVLSKNEWKKFLTHFSEEQRNYASCDASSTCKEPTCQWVSSLNLCLPRYLQDQFMTSKFIRAFSLTDEAKRLAYQKCLTGKKPNDNQECISCGGTIGLPDVSGKDLTACKSSTTIDTSNATPPPAISTTSSTRGKGDGTGRVVATVLLLKLITSYHSLP